METLIEAATRVLSTSGLEETTPNAKAELAWVSIGLLYQYFTEKLALLDAVSKRHIIGLWQNAHTANQEGMHGQAGSIAVH